MAAQGGDAVIEMGGSQLATINHDQDQYYSSRADAMHTIESTIVELGGIFSQLATMVKEQEEMVTRIDNNIDDTALNVELGHNEILKWVPGCRILSVQNRLLSGISSQSHPIGG